MAVERNTQQTDSGQERDIHPLAAFHGVAFVHTPDDACSQNNHVNDDTRIKWQAEVVDKQQLKPSAYLHNTRYDAIQYDSYQNHGTSQGYQTAFQVGIGVFLVIIYQYDGRNTQ